MGSGKTTIGTLLARQLAWRFVDLDDRIEGSAGLSIPEIFERLGEPAFRQIEADQLRAALGRATELKESTVLALGGGTYAQPGCPEFLRAAGIPVLWLDSPVEVLLARCMTMTGRPLFRDEASFSGLYAQRLPSINLPITAWKAPANRRRSLQKFCAAALLHPLETPRICWLRNRCSEREWTRG